MQLTHLALPQMAARRRGVIVNLSSLSDLAPLPLQSVYAASKVGHRPCSVHYSFQHYSHSSHASTAALHSEYADKGVTIQVRHWMNKSAFAVHRSRVCGHEDGHKGQRVVLLARPGHIRPLGHRHDWHPVTHAWLLDTSTAGRAVHKYPWANVCCRLKLPVCCRFVCSAPWDARPLHRNVL